MAEYSCPAHGPFATKQLLLEHMALKHGVQLEKVAPAPEFQEQIKRIEEKKVVAPQVPTLTPQQVSTPPIVRKPLQLTYQWVGNCPECSNLNIKTIILKTGRTHIAVCYCMICQKDIAQKIIKPLEDKEEKNGNPIAKTQVSKPKTLRNVSKTTK